MTDQNRQGTSNARPWQKNKAVKLTTDTDGKVVIQVRIPAKRYNQTEWMRCQRFLLDLLSKGPLPATKAKKAAQLAGFSDSIIRQSKERTGIGSEYRGTVEKHGIWWWNTPDDTKAT